MSKYIGRDTLDIVYKNIIVYKNTQSNEENKRTEGIPNKK